MQHHDLIKQAKGYYCSLCEQTWKGKPRKACPGTKLVKYNSVLASKSKPEDYLLRQNLRLLDVVCCYFKDKQYHYLYDRLGATEPFYPNLPPAIEYPSYKQIQDFYNPSFDAELCLKNETGLKSLNLKPNGKPVRVWWNGDDYQMLYDPAEAIVLDRELPKIYQSEALIKEDYGSAIADSDFAPLNLKAEDNLEDEVSSSPRVVRAVGVVWRNRNWTYYYLPKDTEVADPNLPPIYKSYKKLQDIYPNSVAELKLEERNLLPRESAVVGVVWNEFHKLYEYYYQPDLCQVADPSLPQIYRNPPTNLLLDSELKIFNRTPTPKAIAGAKWDSDDRHFVFLYDPNRCLDLHADKLPVYARDSFIPRRRDENGDLIKVDLPHGVAPIPDRLKTAYIWSQQYPLLEVNPEASPKGCVWRNGWENLYAFEDLIVHDRDIYISKTKLKQIYHLSKNLIEKLGKPDYYAENPINDRYPEVQQYSRYRVEKFLKDNAEVYAKHLARYDHYLAIFNANKEKIAAGRKRAKSLGTKGKVLAQQFNWNFKDLEIYEQCLKCLTCASSMASNSGFLCAIHPLGLDCDSIPCPEWSKRD